MGDGSVDDMGVIPVSVPLHEHDDSVNGVNDQTEWNVVTLKQYVDSEFRNMFVQRESVIQRIELAIANIHDEIRYREQSSEKAIDKAITQVTLQNEALRRDAEARAAAVLEAVNTLARANETRFAKQEQLIGAVATLEVQLDATRRESGIVNQSNQLAIDKAETANEKRFDSVNGLKGQLAEFMPRELAESKISEATSPLATRMMTAEKTLAELRSWQDTQSGQNKGVGASIAWIIAGIGVLGTILAMVVTVIALVNVSP